MKARVKGLAIASLIVSFLVSCGVRTYTLKDGRTKVPKYAKVYVNKVNFDKKLLEQIDTTAIYEEYHGIQSRLDSDKKRSVYGNYRFFSTGCLMYFVLNKEDAMAPTYFDPAYTGARGVYYINDNIIRFDVFVEKGDSWIVGRESGSITIRGDTIIVQTDWTPYNKSVPPVTYVKRELPKEFFKYRADW